MEEINKNKELQPKTDKEKKLERSEINRQVLEQTDRLGSSEKVVKLMITNIEACTKGHDWKKEPKHEIGGFMINKITSGQYNRYNISKEEGPTVTISSTGENMSFDVPNTFDASIKPTVLDICTSLVLEQKDQKEKKAAQDVLVQTN